MKRKLELTEREERALREFFMQLGAHGYLRTDCWLMEIVRRDGTAAALRRVARKLVTGKGK